MKIIFLTIFAMTLAHAAPNFCSVEVRKCKGELYGPTSRCGYSNAIAFINCGEGDVFKLKGDSIEERIDRAMSERGMAFRATLNEKSIYSSSLDADICYAEMKLTQVGATLFAPLHLMQSGFKLQCTNEATTDSLTLGESNAIGSRNSGALGKAMKKRGYVLSQTLPIYTNERNEIPLESTGMMFGDGDSRYFGFIFQLADE